MFPLYSFLLQLLLLLLLVKCMFLIYLYRLWHGCRRCYLYVYKHHVRPPWMITKKRTEKILKWYFNKYNVNDVRVWTYFMKRDCLVWINAMIWIICVSFDHYGYESFKFLSLAHIDTCEQAQQAMLVPIFSFSCVFFFSLLSLLFVCMFLLHIIIIYNKQNTFSSVRTRSMCVHFAMSNVNERGSCVTGSLVCISI